MQIIYLVPKQSSIDPIKNSSGMTTLYIYGICNVLYTEMPLNYFPGTLYNVHIACYIVNIFEIIEIGAHRY